MTDDKPKKSKPSTTRLRLRATFRWINRICFWTLVIAVPVVAIGWFQSKNGGFEQRWVDSDFQSCGRVVSTGGRFFVQTCDLSNRFPQPGDYPLEMPADFSVGSGQSSEPIKLRCGLFRIPFREPSSGLFIGASWEIKSQTTSNPLSRWTSSVSEQVIAYWLIEGVLVMLLTPVLFGYVLRWFRANLKNGS